MNHSKKDRARFPWKQGTRENMEGGLRKRGKIRNGLKTREKPAESEVGHLTGWKRGNK